MITFGGILFWIILSVILVVLVFLVEHEEGGTLLWPSFIIAFLVVAGWVFYRRELAPFFTSVNLLTLIIYIAIYMFIGVVWSFFKWYKFTDKMVNDHIRRHGRDVRISWPQVSENKEQVFSWILLFPISMIRYVIGNLLSDFMSWLIEKFSGVYSRITQSIINKYSNGTKEDMG